jgi:transcriptional antiterminator RfaH
MPIVATEVAIYPDNLLDGFGAADGERSWWAAYTKVRQEKRLAEDLAAREIPFYLPLVSRRHLYRGRIVDAQIPLFCSYVFLFNNPRERMQSLATHRIAQLVPVADGARLHHDLAQVQRLIEARVPLTVEARLRPGQRVRVRHGSLVGLEGVVESRRQRSRLTVAITLLQRGISVEVDDFMLEPLDVGGSRHVAV